MLRPEHWGDENTATKAHTTEELTSHTYTQDSAMHLHLMDKGHLFEDHMVQILARDDRWSKTGVKDTIFVKIEQSTLNGGGGPEKPYLTRQLCSPKVSLQEGKEASTPTWM